MFFFQKEGIAKFYAEKAPKFFAALEKMLTDNHGGEGFFVGSKVKLGDSGKTRTKVSTFSQGAHYFDRTLGMHVAFFAVH